MYNQRLNIAKGLGDRHKLQAQFELTKDELLLETNGRTITCSVKEVASAGGIRLEMNDRGETKGWYDASRIETVSVQIKPDGMCEWETKGFDVTKDGGVIGFVGKGVGTSSAPGILAGTISLNGETHFMTMVKELRWLQTTKCWLEMSINIASGEFRRKVYAKK